MQIAKEKFYELLKDFNAVMLITHVTRGDAHATDINARPMGIAQVEPNCDLWFITGADTETVHDIASDSHSEVGGIRQANQGVFEIQARDQAQGISEASQIMKTVRVVSAVDYFLRH
ncbi:MAG TPA: pyridoxamine 5'-phosphate oxidase family protein [Gemmatimonadaceae bacterium]|jgi:general stress protein 26|nr:pyridoxamine 5'-phosphate oxidase family protein [Gemmatimonadaceae bacterium]